MSNSVTQADEELARELFNVVQSHGYHSGRDVQAYMAQLLARYRRRLRGHGK